MKIECYTYYGQDDNQKVIYIEKKTLSANDERVKKYQAELNNIQAYAKANGYRVIDINLIQEEDYPMEHGRSR